MHIEFQKVYISKSQAKWPLYRLSCMRKRLSVSSRVSWETTILSVNPVLIVLEASFSSVNPVPIVCEYAYLQTNYISVTFFTEHPYWSVCFLAMSVNFRWRPYSLQTPSGNIRRNFPSKLLVRMSQVCPRWHNEIYGCCKDNTDDIRITCGSVADINYTWQPNLLLKIQAV